VKKVIHRLDWEDDRVECGDCKRFYTRHVGTSYSVDDMERWRKVNHPALRWMFEVAVVNQGVATVQYTKRACRAKGLEPMPDGLLHRCEAFQPKIEEVVKDEEGQAWWE